MRLRIARMECAVTSLLMLLLVLPASLAYPSGAPDTTCDSMLPVHHDAKGKLTPPPYTITLSDTTVDGEGSLQVTLSGKNGATFKGFIVKAINEAGANGGSLGYFQDPGTNGDYQRLTCAQNQLSKEAATHTSKSVKATVVFTWVAPADFNGRVKFVATVLQEFSTFWANVASDSLVTVSQRSGSVKPKQFSPSSNTPPMSRPGSTASSSNAPKSFNYKSCGDTLGCFGYPDKCVSSGTCEMLLSFAPSRVRPDEVDFHLQGLTDGYVAMGFSFDRKMGNDAVVQCVLDSSSRVFPYTSYNDGRSNGGTAPLDGNLVSSSDYQNGVVRCVYSQKRSINVPAFNTTFHLDTTPYYLFLARGSALSRGNLKKHDLFIRSSRPVGMSDLMIVGSNDVDLEIMIHGSLMVVAWVGTVSIAVYLARYYKDMWPDKTHCGVKIWFAWHRSLNALTVLLTLAAFILIFVYVNGFSQIWETNPHPILGCITTGLMVLQPLGALCRPHPGTTRRPIFNWLHYLGGMLACACGIITLFFAVRLPSAGLPEYFWWILIAFVGFYVLMFCVMEFFTCLSSRKSEKEVIPMKEFNGNGGSLNTSASGSVEPQGAKFKLVMLWLFVAGALGFSAALVVVIVV